MARIPMTNGFMVIPEGEYVFRIYDAKYDEEFGRITVKMVTAKGMTHTERFSIKTADGFNEGALNAFSYFARTATQDYESDDIDPEQLINRYIKAVVEHNIVPSNKEEGKTVTFARLGDKFPANEFDETPVPRALSLGRETQTAPAPAPAPAPAQAPASALDVMALLNS
mgnify:CR=1 FL=1